MSRVHVYIKPFADAEGNYAADFTEVTNDVINRSLGGIKQQLDSSEYDIGVFRNSNMRLKLNNAEGKYKDVDESTSIFQFKRSDSIVRITWEPGEHVLMCGFFQAGNTQLSNEITVFEGLLEDTAEKETVDDQTIDFNVLGYEALLDRVTVPFSTISNGDAFEDIIFDLLNQTEITGLLTVSAGNISVGSNILIDDKASLENLTVTEALRRILLLANAVLFLEDTTVKVQPRTPGATNVYTFYGQATAEGAENIAGIRDFRTGLNRTFNHWRWKDTSLLSQDVTSISKFGIRFKELDDEMITDGGKRQTILDNLKTEFANPKPELRIEAPLEPDLINDVFMLDRVTIDYPEVPIISSDQSLATYGISEYEVAVYPDTLSNFSIDSSRKWKVLSRQLNAETNRAMYLLREIAA